MPSWSKLGESHVWTQQNLKRSKWVYWWVTWKTADTGGGRRRVRRSLPLDKQQANRSRGPWGVGGNTYGVPPTSVSTSDVWTDVRKTLDWFWGEKCYPADLDTRLGLRLWRTPSPPTWQPPHPDTYTFISLLTLDFCSQTFFLTSPRADPSLFLEISSLWGFVVSVTTNHTAAPRTNTHVSIRRRTGPSLVHVHCGKRPLPVTGCFLL